jgi:hypothetical protein
VFQGDDGAIDLDVTTSELEIVIAGNADDVLRSDGSAVVALAGGGGSDTFNLQITGGSPTIVWGGAGADVIDLSLGAAARFAVRPTQLFRHVAGTACVVMQAR